MVSTPREAPARRSRFFLVSAAVIVAVVIAGFTPTFFLRPHFREAHLAGYVLLHGVIMSAWQLLALAQAGMIQAGRSDLHRKLGLLGAALAVAVAASGSYTSLNLIPRLRSSGNDLSSPEDQFGAVELSIGNLMAFVQFGGLVLAAILLRRKVATHKRLMFWAFVATSGPALSNARWLGQALATVFNSPWFPPSIVWTWAWFIALLWHDWRTERRFHPATVVGGILMIFVSLLIADWVVRMEAVQAWALARG